MLHKHVFVMDNMSIPFYTLNNNETGVNGEITVLSKKKISKTLVVDIR